MADQPLVRFGDRGDRVTYVQTLLVQVGYVAVDIDGRFGPDTLKAVKHWQKVNGIEQTGIVGPKTWRAFTAIKIATTPLSAGSGGLKPATRVNPPQAPPGDVEAIIRDVWPDEIEGWAVSVASRESNLQPGARNWCCYGLFQIYFQVHRSWLDDYGVYQPSDLFDPRVNATVALALYQATGPEPWACHGQCTDV